MASRLSRAAFARVARPAARVSGRTVGRRGMSSSSGHSEGSDMPWMIGSALVFGPAALYLLSPSAQTKAHHAQQHSLPKEKHSHPEDAPVPPTPPPQELAPKKEPNSAEGVKDDEGNAASTEEVTESINKAVDEDSPKEAQSTEAGQERPEDKSAPGGEGDKAVAEKAEPAGKHEQDKPPASEAKEGSTTESQQTPADLGDARSQSKSGDAPKESTASH